MLATSVPGLFCISVGASALGGALGMSSGIFIVPILTLIAGVDVRVAIGASIVSVIACSCGSAASFLKERLTNVRLAIVLETATTLGAASGVLLSGVVSVPVLYAVFAMVLLVSAWQMLMRRGNATAHPHGGPTDGWVRRLDSVYPDRAIGSDVAYRIERLPAGLALMYGAGLLSALLGIGSGVLKIPAMDTALRLPIKVSSATSNFMIGVTAAASAGAYFIRGAIVPAIAGPVALGSVVGALLGARLLVFIAPNKLRLVFVVALLVLAIQMVFAAVGVRRVLGA
ncbi:sulfite exporter TauE/SafE family protein [Dyella psychrodurans]|uniref:Probable membrane transporter protein n=1 Tax=Dyella psychrodurans TaxID=1927960 RepID=A0A370X070_9GAMM|nr:sulfite exporter TauE/SafE family protein [Dyella psychrodurans]RDS81813.1 sulfite exporter TauE/SafE family protein [Dyella psychrodurans]